ncbi:MAG: hypothetical protein JSU88_11375 [Nitrospinaceae bacterium]|nr:MAG: hypothetical protein JSU88_11375 [Nitrospinaceae bacterium]
MIKTRWFVALFIVGLLVGAIDAAADEREDLLRRQIEINQQMLDSRPDDANLHFMLGNDHYKLAQHLKERGSWFWQTNNKIADGEEAERLYDISVQYLAEAVRLQPGHASAHFNLAVNYFLKEKKEAALYHMTRADRLYLETGNTKGLEKSKKALKEWYEAFDYNPGDFDVAVRP